MMGLRVEPIERECGAAWVDLGYATRDWVDPTPCVVLLLPQTGNRLGLSEHCVS